MTHMGDFENGKPRLVRHAQRLDPLHAGWYHFSFAPENNDDRNSAEMISRHMQRTAMPHFFWTHMLTAAAKVLIGHPDTSYVQLEKTAIIANQARCPEKCS